MKLVKKLGWKLKVLGEKVGESPFDQIRKPQNSSKE